jgi:hypothetical protein
MHNSPQRVSLLLVGLVGVMFAYAGQPKEEGIQTISETKSLKSDTVYEFSRLVGLGRIVKVRDGKDGSITKVFKLLKKEGKIVGKELIREEKIDAVPTTYRLGNGGYNASRAGGTFKAKKVLTMRASAYDPGPHSNGKWAGKTTLGVRPTHRCFPGTTSVIVTKRPCFSPSTSGDRLKRRCIPRSTRSVRSKRRGIRGTTRRASLS